ncbi:GNAT family N-acetyltransferase [Phenylobacterium sp.]|uniref:GNAT family N-acetyltransferase n=1 Tax=Phenylobacterium sp. TaxID=1871053 RepID=UPI00356567AD
MDAQETYGIRPVTPADLPLIARWRAAAHVARWWGQPGVEPEIDKLAEPRIAMWLVEQDGRPFAFLQDYDVHGWDPHPFSDLPPGSRGIDLYIGEPDMLGRGHGAGLLRQHVDGLFSRGVPVVGIDPHPDNASARRAFERAGFSVVSDPLETPWGHAVLMHRWA